MALEETVKSATPEPAAPASPPHALDDLFDFKEAPAKAAPKKAEEAPAQAAATPAPALAKKKAAPPAPRFLRMLATVPTGAWIGLGLMANALVLFLLVRHFERSTQSLITNLENKESRTPSPPPSKEPRLSPKPAPVSRSQTPTSSAPAGRSPSAETLLRIPDALLAKGHLAEARKSYYEILLSPPSGPEGAEASRLARLRLAQALAREGAAETAPIRLRFDSITGGDVR